VTTRNALVLLTDGRFPSGAHPHSAGIEVAVARRAVTDLDDLARFLLGRVHTAGLVDAAFVAWIVRREPSEAALPWDDVDAEVSARIASPAQRATSRRLGRQLARVAARVWPSVALATVVATNDGPHHVVALGAAAASAGLPVADAAFVAAHGAVTVPAYAAMRLLGLDPVALQALLAELGPAVDAVVDEAVQCAGDPLDALPCLAAPASELAAEEQAERSPRLFAS